MTSTSAPIRSTLTTDELRRLSALIDEGFALATDHRQSWLDSLADRTNVSARMQERIRAAMSEDEVTTPEALQKLAEPQRIVSASTTVREGAQFADYILDKLIARGGMGDVWKAHRAITTHEETVTTAPATVDRIVALKLPHVGTDGWRLAGRFHHERQILAKLTHPSIAAFYDSGAVDQQPFLALEYVDGELINQWCDRKQLSIAQRIKLFLQVLEAVQYAHNNLVIHRDLKPSNIMVTADGHIKLLDFGIAKMLSSEGAAEETELTRAVGRAFTSSYASPEQISGGTLTTSSDIYSLGVVLYELLTGERPYRLKRGTPAALEEAILNTEPLRPSKLTQTTVRERVPIDLESVILKALSKAPNERYATCSAFSDDLQRYLNLLPVRARKSTWLYQTKKFVLRHRLAVSIGAIATCLIASGIYAFVRQARDTERAKLFLLSTFTPFDQRATPGNARVLPWKTQLDRAVEQVGKDFADRPTAAIDLYNHLAEVLRRLGEHESALQASKLVGPLIKEEFGHQSFEYVVVQSRVADLYVVMRRLEDFSQLMPELRKTCPLDADSKRLYKCLPLERSIAQYQIGIGEARVAAARWRTIGAGFKDKSLIYYRIATVFGGTSSRSTGDLSGAKYWFNEMRDHTNFVSAAAGRHWYALNALKVLADAGHGQNAEPLASQLYQQGFLWHGNEYDSAHFFITGWSEMQAALGRIDNLPRLKAIVDQADSAPEAQRPAQAQQTAGPRSTLGWMYLLNGQYDLARKHLSIALELNRQRNSVTYNEYAKRIESLLAVLTGLQGDRALARKELASLSKEAHEAGAHIESLRAKALEAMFVDNANERDFAYRAVVVEIAKTDHRIPDVWPIAQRLGLNWTPPASNNDDTFRKMQDYAHSTLDQTQRELSKKENAEPAK